MTNLQLALEAFTTYTEFHSTYIQVTAGGFQKQTKLYADNKEIPDVTVVGFQRQTKLYVDGKLVAVKNFEDSSRDWFIDDEWEMIYTNYSIYADHLKKGTLL